MKYEKILGKNIARIRKQQGFTQKEFESETKNFLSRAHYGKLELGKYSPRFDTLKNIASVFGIRIVDLFYDENNEYIFKNEEEL